VFVVRRYDSVYNRVPGGGDGQRVNHVVLHNINMDQAHRTGCPL